MKVLLTIVLIIGLVAGAAKPFNAHVLLPQMGDAHVKKMMISIKSRLRGFDAQQAQYLLPVSDAEICKGTNFATDASKMYTLCSRTSVIPLVNQSVTPTTQGIRTAWENYCSGVCMAASNALLDTYEVCLHPHLKLQAMAQRYLCSTRDSAGDRCGVTMSTFSEVTSCQLYDSQSTCDPASEFCTWTVKDAAPSTCVPMYSQKVLSSICGSCLMGFAMLSNQFPSYGTEGISDTLELFCLRAPSGAYCLPLLQTEAAAPAEATDVEVPRLCGNKDLYYCIRAMASQGSAMKISEARREFVACAATYKNLTSSIESHCLPNFVGSVISARSSNYDIDAMCLRNAKGDYCLLSFFSFLFADCTLSTRSTGQCDAPCPAVLADTVNTLGCCIGTFQEMITAQDAHLSPEDLPYIPGHVPTPTPTMLPAPATTAPVILRYLSLHRSCDRAPTILEMNSGAVIPPVFLFFPQSPQPKIPTA
jgi:hypothetical protein